jgi:hypothetical protein
LAIASHLFDLPVVSGFYGITAIFCKSDLIGYSVPTSICLGQHVQQPVITPTDGNGVKAGK